MVSIKFLYIHFLLFSLVSYFFLTVYLLIFVRFLVRVSYLEIYNEDVRDLLGKDQNASLEVCDVKKYIVAGCFIQSVLGF